MPPGTPAKRETKKPKKDAAPKSVRSGVGETTATVELVQKRRKEREG
jgi:hypothetical protein